MYLKQTIIATAIMLLTSTVAVYLKNIEDHPPTKKLSAFPTKIDGWQGTKSRFDEKVYEILGVDDSVLVNYHNNKDSSIQLYVGYYQSQKEDGIIHSPKNCMPGSGWNIVENTTLTLGMETKNGKPIKIVKLLLQNGLQKQVALYWFHSRGRVIHSEYAQKIYLVWDAVTRRRTDGSFIRLLSPTTNENEQQTTENLMEFTKQIIPLLNEFIPN